MNKPERTYQFNPEHFPNDLPSAPCSVKGHVDLSANLDEEMRIPEMEYLENLWIEDGMTGPSLLPDSWVLINSKVEKGIDFSGTRYLTSQQNSYAIESHTIEICFIEVQGDIVFNECNFKGSLSLGHLTVDGDIRFENSKIGDLFLHNISAKNISFWNCQFTTINLHEVYGKNLRLFKTSSGDKLVFTNIQTKELVHFENISIEGLASIEKLNAGTNFHLEACIFKNDLIVEHLRCKTLDLDDNTFERRMILALETLENKKNPQEFKLGKSIKKLVIFGGVYKYGGEIMLDNHHLKEVMIETRKGLESTLRIQDGYIDKLSLTGVNEGGGLYFDDLEISQVDIHYFKNSGQVTFAHLVGANSNNSSLKIQNSNLGSMEFIDTCFNEFDEVVIEDSFLDDIRFSNVIWPHPDDVNEFYDGKAIAELNQYEMADYLGNQREVYRQLKYAAEKQGDRAQALEFKAEEYIVYRKLLQVDINYIKGQSEKISSDYKDLWRLRAGKWSIIIGDFTNRLGVNWLRPLAQILIITLLAYPFFVVAASDELTWWPFGNELAIGEGISLLWQKAGALPQLFNPARYLTRVFEAEHLPGIVYFIDALHRIILTFYIYQIISAFRKYFK